MSLPGRDSIARSRKADWKAGIEDVGLKPELEDNVRPRIIVIVDLDLIHDRWIERKIIRSIARLQKRINVQDERDKPRMIVADKRVKIGDVSCVIQGGDRCFPVARRKCAWWNGNDQTQRESDCGLQF